MFSGKIRGIIEKNLIIFLILYIIVSINSNKIQN
jgi:hypothetical protein